MDPYIPSEEECSDGWQRYVIDGDTDGMPDPSPEEVDAALARGLRALRCAKVCRLLAALLLLFVASTGFACGETKPLRGEQYVVIYTTGYGSRCPSTRVYGPFKSYEQAMAWGESRFGEVTPTTMHFVRSIEPLE